MTNGPAINIGDIYRANLHAQAQKCPFPVHLETICIQIMSWLFLLPSTIVPSPVYPQIDKDGTTWGGGGWGMYHTTAFTQQICDRVTFVTCVCLGKLPYNAIPATSLDSLGVSFQESDVSTSN